MAQFELVMPKMGESVAEATIIKWTKNEGDAISADETVLEIATDKVDSEVPAARAGILEKKLFKEGEVVAVGTAVAIMRDASSEPASTPAIKPAPEKAESPVVHNISASAVVASADSTGRFYSPLVKNIAKQEGISHGELDTIVGSGKDGRVTKEDILNYLPQRSKTPAPVGVPVEQVASPAPKSEAVQSKPAPVISLNAGDEMIEMDRMRKLIADHMVRSKQTSPHVTSFVEADVTNLVLWREKVKKEYEKRENEKITFTPLFVEAVAKAIRDFPMINVSVDGSTIIRKKSINIGMATALPSGNLIVPVIRNADMLNLSGLTRSVNDLALRARENKLQPDEISGGTFTISNVGSFGNVMGTPIINQPQVAILAVGAIKKKPAVLETPQGDVIAIRHMMFLSLSYDHRVVDGSLGGTFLRKVADYLENFDLNRPI
ncbi:MAG: dihydrolipoamide acetyltransferase family protein [Bacteroidota bacterium]|jgi:2-oxoglutarate dehydrogenase E2 component (dihydrolipoamide succinyltransferase)